MVRMGLMAVNHATLSCDLYIYIYIYLYKPVNFIQKLLMKVHHEIKHATESTSWCKQIFASVEYQWHFFSWLIRSLEHVWYLCTCTYWMSSCMSSGTKCYGWESEGWVLWVRESEGVSDACGFLIFCSVELESLRLEFYVQILN